MDAPPPPPPPHGQNPKTSSGLPPGNYDIFIIPPHSAGGGFIYLPSLRPNTNSFVAGFASCLVMVVITNALKPIVVAWWSQARIGGGAGMFMMVIAVGMGAWAMGRAQTEGGASGGGSGSGSAGGSAGGTYAGANAGSNPGAHSQSHPNGYARGASAPPPQSGPPPSSHGGPPPTSHSTYENHTEPPPNTQWQPPPPTPEPQPESTSAPPPTDPKPQAAASSAWEKAREETRRKEEERKAREAEKKRREELDRKIKEMRAKEAREQEARDKKKKEEAAQAAAAEAKKLEERKKLLAEAKARLAERKAAEAAKQADAEKAKELAAKKAADEVAAKKATEVPPKPPQSTYAFSSVGERMSPWPNGKPPSSPPKAQPPPSPKKAPPPPSAKTYVENEEDAYSYRPYDKPKRPAFNKAPSSVYSDSTYASQTTFQTTPNVSQRGPYSTQDPNKIQIKAVYSFTNAFVKTPTSQLVSGVGSVTDGLILRITTEGLFIDDDVRGVPQREWDVKAWTMKLVEVWCPSFRQDSTRASTSATPSNKTFRRLWGLDKEKPATSEEVDALLLDMLQLCKNHCRLRAANARLSSAHDDARSYATSSVYSASSAASSDRDSVFSAADERANKRAGQTGQNKDARLHVLRASIRDQEGKKYLFVISEEESWKISVGLQRLRKGSQVRALGVSGMSANDARTTLDNLGWK